MWSQRYLQSLKTLYEDENVSAISNTVSSFALESQRLAGAIDPVTTNGSTIALSKKAFPDSYRDSVKEAHICVAVTASGRGHRYFTRTVASIVRGMRLAQDGRRAVEACTLPASKWPQREQLPERVRVSLIIVNCSSEYNDELDEFKVGPSPSFFI